MFETLLIQKVKKHVQFNPLPSFLLFCIFLSPIAPIIASAAGPSFHVSLQFVVCQCCLSAWVWCGWVCTKLINLANNWMQESSWQLQAVNPLIRLVREREELYFELLSFVNSHLSSSSNDLDHIVFTKFSTTLELTHQTLVSRGEALVQSLVDPFAQGQSSVQDPISKQMLRLSSRVLQILQASIARVRKSVFEQSGRAGRQFTRFKSSLNKILKREYFIVRDFVEHILSYCTAKFRRQFAKLKRYLERLQQGDQVWFRELYSKETSDVEHSVSPSKREEEKTVRRITKKVDLEQHLSSTEEPEKKALSLKKTVKTVRKKERGTVVKGKGREQQGETQQPPTKEQTANRLYKFYGLLQLNKKEFLEDYVFERAEEERQRAELLGKLLERNKAINSQINGHVRKSMHCLPVPVLPAPSRSSGDERNESMTSKASLRTSFVISKRRASFHLETGEKPGKTVEKEKELETTIKNLNPRRRSSHSNQRVAEKSKKLFVVKAPLVFEEEIIPQAPVTQTQWLQAPLSGRGKEKRQDNIRLKRKHNVNPLENAFLPENFRYPF